MFDIDNCGIPKDKIDYVCKMIENGGVTIIVQPSEANPYLVKGHHQQREDILVSKFKEPITSRDMSQQEFEHTVMTFKKDGMVRNLYFSTETKSYDQNEDLVPNPQLTLENSVPEDILPLFMLMGWLGTLRLDWEHLREDDIFAWAESYNCAELLKDENSYLYCTFDYLKDLAQTLVDIFGGERMDQAMQDLSVCGSCGVPYGE